MKSYPVRFSGRKQHDSVHPITTVMPNHLLVSARLLQSHSGGIMLVVMLIDMFCYLSCLQFHAGESGCGQKQLTLALISTPLSLTFPPSLNHSLPLMSRIPPVKFDTTKYAIVKQDTKGHVNHANIHSCIASRGVCSPFVSNTPGLATHTKAMDSDLDANGTAVFNTEVSLTAEGSDSSPLLISVFASRPSSPVERMNLTPWLHLPFSLHHHCTCALLRAKYAGQHNQAYTVRHCHWHKT